MNFARDVVDAAPPARRALVALGRDGSRAEWSFGEVADASARAAGALAARGVGRGDVVMTLVGNRPEWVLTMLACFRLGAVALPCTEQLRAADLRSRLAIAQPRLVVCDERNLGVLGEAAPDADVLVVPGPELTAAEPAGRGRARPRGPVPRHVHLRHVGRAEGRAARPALPDRPGRCRPSTGWRRRAERLSWCTAASGWSKSARNVFIAPWLRGAAALLHDARFDPHERLEILAREEVDTLCMAPTEYRVIAKRADAAARSRRCAGSSPPARRSTRRCCAPGTRPPGCGSATATARPRPASSPACRSARRRARARWAARCRACRSTWSTASSSPTPRRCRRSSSATSAGRPRRPGRGGPATACAATTTATSTSRAGSTT